MDHLSLQYQYFHALPEEQIDLHTQDTWELSCVIAGAGMRIIGNTASPFTAGDVALVPPGMPHRWYFDRSACDSSGMITTISIMFQQQFIDALFRSFPECHGVSRIFEVRDQYTVYGGKDAWTILQTLKSMGEQSPIERLAAFIRLLPTMDTEGKKTIPYNKVSGSMKRRQQIETYVVCNLSSNLTLDMLARHLNMNRASVCVLFRREFQQTFTEYVNGLRIDKAQQLILHSKKRIQDICFEVGFNNIAHFNHVFHNIVGCSPSSYRNANSPFQREPRRKCMSINRPTRSSCSWPRPSYR